MILVGILAKVGALAGGADALEGGFGGGCGGVDLVGEDLFGEDVGGERWKGGDATFEVIATERDGQYLASKDGGRGWAHCQSLCMWPRWSSLPLKAT